MPILRIRGVKDKNRYLKSFKEDADPLYKGCEG